MPLSVRDGGTWKEAEVHVRDSGTWKEVLEGHVREGGTWKQFHAARSIVLTDKNITSLQVGPNQSALAWIELRNNGRCFTFTDGGGAVEESGEWMDPPDSGAAGDYEVRATLNSGTLSSGSTGTWLNLGTTRQWSVSAANGVGDMDTQSAQILLEIRPTGGSVLDSATIDLTATANDPA